jgi:hypothetical protein
MENQEALHAWKFLSHFAFPGIDGISPCLVVVPMKQFPGCIGNCGGR